MDASLHEQIVPTRQDPLLTTTATCNIPPGPYLSTIFTNHYRRLPVLLAGNLLL